MVRLREIAAAGMPLRRRASFIAAYIFACGLASAFETGRAASRCTERPAFRAWASECDGSAAWAGTQTRRAAASARRTARRWAGDGMGFRGRQPAPGPRRRRLRPVRTLDPDLLVVVGLARAGATRLRPRPALPARPGAVRARGRGARAAARGRPRTRPRRNDRLRGGADHT